MSIVNSKSIPFAAFAPCDVQGCTTYADYEVWVEGPSHSRSICFLCRDHLKTVRAADKRGPNSAGALLGAAGHVLWDARGWHLGAM